jgi:hypothetical protein
MSKSKVKSRQVRGRAASGGLCTVEEDYPEIHNKGEKRWQYDSLGHSAIPTKRIPIAPSPVADSVYEFIKSIRDHAIPRARPRGPNGLVTAKKDVSRLATLGKLTHFKSAPLTKVTKGAVHSPVESRTRKLVTRSKRLGRVPSAQSICDGPHDDLKLDAKTREFAERFGLATTVGEIFQIASASFRICGKPVVRLEIDRDDGDKCLVIVARVSGTVDEVYEANERFITAALKRFHPMILNRVRFVHII